MGIFSASKSKKGAGQGHDCCAPESTRSNTCLSCSAKGVQVPVNTVRFHLKNPWKYQFSSDAYGYCGNANCDIVYFSGDGSQFSRAEIKDASRSDMLNPVICHCFNITRADIESETELGNLKKFVIGQTKEKNCACEFNNPAGKCCLGNFPK